MRTTQNHLVPPKARPLAVVCWGHCCSFRKFAIQLWNHCNLKLVTMGVFTIQKPGKQYKLGLHPYLSREPAYLSITDPGIFSEIIRKRAQGCDSWVLGATWHRSPGSAGSLTFPNESWEPKWELTMTIFWPQCPLSLKVPSGTAYLDIWHQPMSPESSFGRRPAGGIRVHHHQDVGCIL